HRSPRSGEGSHGSNLSGNQAPTRVSSKWKSTGYYLSERSYGAIYRTIPLPPGVDGEKAQASFKNGVLTIKLPQTPEAQAKVRKIAVKEA
ncbi:Hsp20/alpha crystallin family protein, partial [Paracoccus chinensis]